MKITKKTYGRNVKKFAKKAADNWKKLEAFAKKLKLDDERFDELCAIVDDYSAMNMAMLDYTFKNDIDMSDFFSDTFNASGMNLVDKV